jgi:aldose 1-epimerase
VRPEDPLPTGEQHHLRRHGPAGEVTATVTELAASLRSLRVGGRPLVQEYDDHRTPPWGAGIVLVPWPNRVAGARWLLDGAEQRLDVTEPGLGNASHGLLRNTGYRAVERAVDCGGDAVTLAAPVFPQHGYPFHLGTSVRYTLVDLGLTVTHTLVNHGGRPAPVAVGAHPYLRVGDTPVAELVLTVAADTWFEVDDRLVPVGSRPVEGTAYDLRAGVRLGDVALDTAYTDLGRDTDGRHRHRLVAPDGATTELWADPDFGYVQVFTQPAFPGVDGEELAVAVEPMTAPADALNSGAGLRWLEPGETWSSSWGIRTVGG